MKKIRGIKVNNKKSKSTSIGLLGGIFNPIHNGHCSLAALAYDYFGLERVFLIPSGNPPHKYIKDIVSPNHRLAMVKEAVKGCSFLSVWDGEIRRKGISYTIDTIKEFKRTYPNYNLYLIIGSDNLTQISSWYCHQDILNNVILCIAHRPPYSLKIPKELKNGIIKIFPSPEWRISSTMIREYLKKGYSCKYLIPDRVITYIKRNNLYK